MKEKNPVGVCLAAKPSKERNETRKLYSRKRVLKMLAVMEPQQAAGDQPPANSHSQEFLTSGRTGRRNALPDILSQHAIVVTAADLPDRLQSLSTTDGASASTSSARSDGAGCSKDSAQKSAS